MDWAQTHDLMNLLFYPQRLGVHSNSKMGSNTRGLSRSYDHMHMAKVTCYEHSDDLVVASGKASTELRVNLGIRVKISFEFLAKRGVILCRCPLDDSPPPSPEALDQEIGNGLKIHIFSLSILAAAAAALRKGEGERKIFFSRSARRCRLCEEAAKNIRCCSEVNFA